MTRRRHSCPMESNPGTATDALLLPMVGERRPTVFLKTKFSEFEHRISPDGKWCGESAVWTVGGDRAQGVSRWGCGM